MKIIVTSVFVDDQAKALQFYTDVLGFVKKTDVTAGDYRWLTVVPPEDKDGTELLLEPNKNPVAREFQKGLVAQNIPAKMFGVENAQAEYERLKTQGVHFIKEPTNIGPATIAIFDDTCGNLIQISQFNKM
jgi:catechol 2,3-dioxygenase-like lactoylglutathione lyase family enzyme